MDIVPAAIEAANREHAHGAVFVVGDVTALAPKVGREFALHPFGTAVAKIRKTSDAQVTVLPQLSGLSNQPEQEHPS